MTSLGHHCDILVAMVTYMTPSLRFRWMSSGRKKIEEKKIYLLSRLIPHYLTVILIIISAD